MTFTVSGGLPTTTVHVWRTDPNPLDPGPAMVHLSDITPDANGKFLPYVLTPGYIYTFTTLTPWPYLPHSFTFDRTTMYRRYQCATTGCS